MKIFDLESEISLSRYRKNLFVFITLFIITLSIYSNTFSASWHFDDIPNITGNPNLHLKELSWQNIKRTFFANQFEPEQLYRPAACLSFALNYYFGQDNVLGFHIVNISIHFLSAVFLFLFIYHTLNLPLVSARYGPNSYFVALLATTLWVINPIQTQAITFIVQRMASMAGMFYIISMYLYLRGRMASQNPVKAFFFSLCALSTILAFFSKENALMIPVSLFFYDFLLIQGVSREKVKKNLKILLAVTVMTLSIAIVFFVFSEITFSSLFSLYSNRPFTLWERLITQSRAIIFYISLIIYPMSTRLSLNHDIVISNSLFDPPTTILAIILIIGVVTGAISIAKREPLISFSVFFFFLNHIAESTILPLELIYEHRNYIPSMLFFVPIAIGLLRIITYFSYKRSMQTIISLSIILVIIGEGHSTFMRNFTWKNEESLWIDCVDKHPNLYRPQHNLANYYHDQNKIKKAIEEYEKALKLKAANTKDEKAITYFNLGVIYFHKKEFKKAKDYYLQAMSIDPCLPGVHNNLAVILAATTKSYEEVYGELNRAAKCKPASMRTHSNLGILLVKSGRIDEGIGEMKKALEIEPNNIPTLERLGYAYIRKGMLGTASIYFKRTLNQMIPMNISALLYLAEIYTLSGHKEKAQNSLSQFVDFAHYTDLGSLLNKLYGEESLLTISPDMNVVLPLLSKAYEEKAMSLRKSIDFCLDKL